MVRVVVRRLLLGLLGRIATVRTLSTVEIGLIAYTEVLLRLLCFWWTASGLKGYGVRVISSGSEFRGAVVSIGGGTTWTFLFSVVPKEVGRARGFRESL